MAGLGPMEPGRVGSGPMGLGPMGLGPMGLGPMGLGPMGLGPMGPGPVYLILLCVYGLCTGMPFVMYIILIHLFQFLKCI